MRTRRHLTWCRRVCFLVLLAGWSTNVWADTEATQVERLTETGSFEYRTGRIKLRGSAKAWGDVARLKGGVEVHRLADTPFFFTQEARFDDEHRLPYDLRRWGGDLGLGWQLNEDDALIVRGRLDSYKVYNTGSNVDPAFRGVEGRTQVTALGLAFRHDSRDNALYPTRGTRLRLSGEFASDLFGGDYDFARLEADGAVYKTIHGVTFVERLKVGWVEDMDGDAVPFFERYFVGGASTVRGSRSRWYTPRGLEQQFVGGEIQLVNNLEARRPIFTEMFNRQLSAAVFFDLGRAYHQFSEIGDFGYGVGGGLRYAVHLWKLHGVVRADYGINLDDEGDNSSSKLNVAFGLPF